MKRIEWHGLYSESWGGDLVPEAYAHPAKYSRGLIRQIYRYMLERGMVATGDAIGDPFGGQAGGALDAMRLGLHWRGVELEPRFVELGNANIELWNGRYSPHFSGWGTAVLVQGDSRFFSDTVGELAGVVSSPPYQGSGTDGTDNHNVKVGFNRQVISKNRAGNIKPGEAHEPIIYGDTQGQLGAMPPGNLDAVVSSPPYSGDTVHGRNGIDLDKTQRPGKNSQAAKMDDYGTTEGQLGAASPDTFWSASRAIVEQVYLSLKPGGYAAWVCGDFVRKGKRVEFGRQWLSLCEAVGFEAHTWAIAWKTETHGTQSHPLPVAYHRQRT